MAQKGISMISSVIFIAITLAAIGIVYQAGVPVIQKMQASASVDQMKSVFSDVDKVIREVASEGTGSKRTLYMKIDPGKVIVNETEDAVYWELETDAHIIDPRTSQSFGNVVIGSNLEVSSLEENYSATSPQIPAFRLENEHLVVYIRRIPVYQDFTTNSLLLGIYNKDLGQWMNNTNLLDITVDDRTDTSAANGTTSVSSIGYNLPSATVSALVNSSYMKYYVNFTLESGEDFLKINAGVA